MQLSNICHRVILGLVLLLLAGRLCFEPSFSGVQAQGADNLFSDDFSHDSGSWHILGSAYRDSANQTLVLTQGEYQKGGAAFLATPIKGSFSASFRYKVGGGYCQGDGFTIFFYKQEYTSVDNGGSLGFDPIDKVVPGYAIEFDSWLNPAGDFQTQSGGHSNTQNDPSANHVALIKDYAGNHLASVDDSRIADNQWHQVRLNVQASSIQVYLDQDLVLEWDGTFDRTYDRLGFSGGTGGPGSNWHIIDDFSISAKNLQTPTLTTTCSSSRTPATFEVQIDGDLTYNGNVIPNAPILFSYSVTGGTTWQNLTIVHTKSDGSYNALWLLPITGEYILKTVYKGNENYLGTTQQVKINLEANANQTKSTPEPAEPIKQFNMELDWVKIAILAFMGALAALSVVVAFRKIRKKKM
jgi:hypothetical protein